jgi:hypothetical protein
MVEGPMRGMRVGTIAYLAALIAVGFFALYESRLCPHLCLIGDSAELVTAALVWGVPHAPGYPLFTALGHAFGWLPVHALPWRVHLTSAVFHAGAVAATVVATFTITRSRISAVAAGFALGISRSFVLGSLYAEVFPLNDLFFACLLAAAVYVRRSRGRRAWGALLGFAVCAGLASAHHMMIALAAPALGMLTFRPMITQTRWFGLSAAFLATALLGYALVPLAAARLPYVSWGDVHDLGSLLRLVTRQDYGGPFSPVRRVSTEPGLLRLGSFGRLVVGSMGLATLAAAAFGVVDQVRRVPAVGASLVLAIVLPGPVFAWANAIDTSSPEMLAYFERFTTMCHVSLAIALGAGIAAARSALGQSRPARVTSALVLSTWVVSSCLHARDVDLVAYGRAIGFAHDLLLGTPDGSLILLSGDQPADAALYVCGVERRCGHRIALSPGMLSLPWKMAQVRRLYPDLEIPWSSGPALKRTHELVATEGPKRPIFVYPDLLDKDPALRASFAVSPDRLLYRVWPSGSGQEMERAALLASARALAHGDCEGCGVATGARAVPWQDALIARAYEAAYVNHAGAARRLPGEGEEVAQLLEARARTLASAARDQGARSMSR